MQPSVEIFVFRSVRLGPHAPGAAASTSATAAASAAIAYLPERPRDQYVTDARYAQIYDAASPVLQCMLEISTQTGTRKGAIFEIRVADFTAERIVIKVGKKERGQLRLEALRHDAGPVRSAVPRPGVAREEPRRRQEPAQRPPVHYEDRQAVLQRELQEPVARRAQEAGPGAARDHLP